MFDDPSFDRARAQANGDASRAPTGSLCQVMAIARARAGTFAPSTAAEQGAH
jgi:hypothetical protein